MGCEYSQNWNDFKSNERFEKNSVSKTAEFDKRRWFYVVSKFSGQELDNF